MKGISDENLKSTKLTLSLASPMCWPPLSQTELGEEVMSRILRVNNPDGDPIGSAESIPGLARLFADVPPGRYHIDEISHDPLPSGHTSRRWGIAVKRGDSSVSIARDIWPNRVSSACEDRFTEPKWKKPANVPMRFQGPQRAKPT